MEMWVLILSVWVIAYYFSRGRYLTKSRLQTIDLNIVSILETLETQCRQLDLQNQLLEIQTKEARERGEA